MKPHKGSRTLVQRTMNVKALSSRFHMNGKANHRHGHRYREREGGRRAEAMRKKCKPFTHDKRLCQKDKWKRHQNKNVHRNTRSTIPNTGHHRVSAARQPTVKTVFTQKKKQTAT